MKKILALVLALLVAGSCLALTADGAKAAAPTVTVTEPTATSARTPDAVRWFEASDGTWIFFLPSAFTAKSLRLWYSGSDVLEVNGAKVASGDTCYLGESGKITAGKNTYPYRVMQSIGVATVFVTTQSGSMTAIDSDPEHAYAESGQLKMTISALTADDVVLHQRVLTDVSVTRNHITTYTGPFFGEGSGQIVQTGFTLTVNGEWDGSHDYSF